MAENVLQLDLDDGAMGLRPEYLSAGVLTKIVAALESAIEEQADDPEGSELPAVSLVGIRDGSIISLLRIGPWAQQAALAVIAAIQSGDLSGIKARCHKKLLDFQKLIVDNGYVARLHGAGGRVVEISAQRPIPQIRQKLVKSRTRLFGVVESVGGEKPSAAIRLFSTGKQLTVSMSAEVAKELGKKLYDWVGLSGDATVDLVSGEYVSFRVEAILKYRGKEASPLAAIDQIERDFPGQWKGVDPTEFVRSLRNEDN